MLGWTRQELADRAILSLNTVIRFEEGIVDPRTSTLQAIRYALESAGIEFVSPRGQGEGVLIRSENPDRTKL